MRAVIQKVTKSNVVVDNEEISNIDQGLLVLLAVKENDDKDDLAYIKKKIEKLRIFEDNEGKMNLSIEEVGGEILLVSQFTLYGDVRKGNRPSFIDSAKPDKANEFYEILKEELIADGFSVKTGKFQTHMEVSLTNDGPCTIILDSERIL
ncbi:MULTISPECIES: D-aminoacyl-tRNA deacylase [Anaerococcus]|jgi:D-tyrosyl-tRNA(Tyr) deacylase|uniref:D-aminoacyl-tRNA deacylase n=1 Tax=Anaerococcus nagyae TaxID=1755241 RepID=A0A3E2TIN3_9FIRM|nr:MULTISPECIES: D-aminoacyl-tRNA deacylase [Anaerococcus]MDU3211277.1 D-aminoacyl-tRNA deacylase [Anaerococcus sp.]RGB76528.1 D-tyrosyl-tRNA(Tyr) deacylase [Anaerococcus nagyae]